MPAISPLQYHTILHTYDTIIIPLLSHHCTSVSKSFHCIILYFRIFSQKSMFCWHNFPSHLHCSRFSSIYLNCGRVFIDFLYILVQLAICTIFSQCCPCPSAFTHNIYLMRMQAFFSNNICIVFIGNSVLLQHYMYVMRCHKIHNKI